jgi:hypothetical protein
MTNTHDSFECLSPRDYIDTKSWLAYEQNPYSIHWVRSGSCHRETSLGYDILHAISWLWANMNIWLLHDATTPRCSELGDCTTLTRPVQPWVATPSPAWLDNTVAIMTRHLHCIAAKLPWQRHRQHDSTAPSPAWLDIYIASRPSQPDSAIANMTQLDNIVTSMTRHLHRVTARSPR